MSARLNMNPIRNVEWKGRTFNQITSVLQRNRSPQVTGIFRALPAKHYRREIVTGVENTNSRIVSIDEVTRAGGTIVTEDTDKGICQTVDLNLVNDSTGRQTYAAECDARRRVRSAGNVKRNHDRPMFSTTTTQYLVNRNRTFKQTEYHHLKSGNDVVEAGQPGALDNIYTPNGLSSCADPNAYVRTYYKPSNSKFAVQGGVSAGSRLERLKLDTITKVAASMESPLGKAVANALSYKASLSQAGMTQKDKLGYPNPKCNKQSCLTV